MFGREHGAKFGGGDLAGEELLKLQRKERTRAIAAEVFDLKNDPYLMRNHLGGLECRLCGTPHTHEANYMVHTEGKKHKENLAKREAAKKRSGAQAGAAAAAAVAAAERRRVTQVRKTAKIGLPGYQMVKQLDRQTNRHSLLFRINFPEIEEGLRPRFRFMSAYEQRVEVPNDKFQYLLVAAEPYQTVAFKIPNEKVDTAPETFLTHWDEESAVFTIQFSFKKSLTGAGNAALMPPAGAPAAAAGAVGAGGYGGYMGE